MFRRKKLLAALLFMGVVVVLLEAASYFVVAVLRDQTLGDLAERHVYSPIRGHELNPLYRRDSDADRVKLHSSQGFRRDSVVTKDKPDNVFRIIALGGSTLYGLGVQRPGHYPIANSLRNDETVTYFLEKTLNDTLKSEDSPMTVEVINAGVIAYHTFQHVLYFYETLYQYDPDMLIFLDGHNDYYRIGIEDPIGAYSYSSYRMIPAINERTPFLSMYLFARYLGQYSYFMKMVEKAAEQMYESYEAKTYSTEGDYTAIERDFSAEFDAWARVGFIRNYKLIEAFSEYYQFSFHVFLQPEVVFEDEDLLGRARPCDSAYDSSAIWQCEDRNNGAGGGGTVPAVREVWHPVFGDQDDSRQGGERRGTIYGLRAFDTAWIADRSRRYVLGFATEDTRGDERPSGCEGRGRG